MIRQLVPGRKFIFDYEQPYIAYLSWPLPIMDNISKAVSHFVCTIVLFYMLKLIFQNNRGMAILSFYVKVFWCFTIIDLLEYFILPTYQKVNITMDHGKHFAVFQKHMDWSLFFLIDIIIHSMWNLWRTLQWHIIDTPNVADAWTSSFF